MKTGFQKLLVPLGEKRFFFFTVDLSSFSVDFFGTTKIYLFFTVEFFCYIQESI